MTGCLSVTPTCDARTCDPQYGGQIVPQRTSPHYTLVTDGVAYSGQGYYVLYQTTDCLCSSASDCKNASSIVYPFTNHGLDRLVQEYLQLGESIPSFPDQVRVSVCLVGCILCWLWWCLIGAGSGKGWCLCTCMCTLRTLCMPDRQPSVLGFIQRSVVCTFGVCLLSVGRVEGSGVAQLWSMHAREHPTRTPPHALCTQVRVCTPG